MAGRRALAHADVSATVNLLSRALALLPTDEPSRIGLLSDLGLALAQSDIARADAVLTEAIDAADALNEPRIGARAGVRRVFVRILLDPQISQASSLHEAEDFVRSFEAWNDDLGLAESRSLVGMIRFWQGRVAASEEEFERALEHARRAGDHRQEGEILRRMALVIDVGPATPEDGIRRLERVLGEAGGDRRVEIGVNRARAELEAMRGRFDAARELIVRGKALARELGDQVALAAVLRHSGTVEMRAGDPVAAETGGAGRLRDPRTGQRPRPSRELRARPR